MMAGALRSVLLTPNLLGADGVSSLSRQIIRALPRPAAVLSLHDAFHEAGDPADVEMHGAGGGRARFLAMASAIALRCSAATEIVCSHLHLAPAAAVLGWRGGRATTVLCGIEAWVPLRAAEAWALDRTALVAISHHTVARFKRANPSLASRDVAVCHPGLPDRVAVPDGVSRPDGSPAMIVARMSADERYKGHDALLELWPEVLARKPDARLVVAGDGSDRPRLEERARSLGLSDAVTFVGRVSDAELAALYEHCRFLVLPSRDEGFGLVFVEAMRAGKACIGARGAAAEIIQHEVTGLIVDPASLDELSDAVVRLFDDPAACRRFGAAGRERFLSTFTDVCFQARFARAIERRRQAS
jgi:glycosyltransferase involved in cell wall biosynthesis